MLQMRPEDFNRTEPYCPHTHAEASSSAHEEGGCQTPTVRQLLGMSSGIIDLANCPRYALDIRLGLSFQHLGTKLTRVMTHPDCIPSHLLWYTLNSSFCDPSQISWIVVAVHELEKNDHAVLPC